MDPDLVDNGLAGSSEVRRQGQSPVAAGFTAVCVMTQQTNTPKECIWQAICTNLVCALQYGRCSSAGSAERVMKSLGFGEGAKTGAWQSCSHGLVASSIDRDILLEGQQFIIVKDLRVSVRAFRLVGCVIHGYVLAGFFGQ